MQERNNASFEKFTQSITFRLLILGVLILVLMIPVSSIRNLIHERARRNKKVQKEISQKWGKKQYVAGPILSIPYKRYVKKKTSLSNDKDDYVVEAITDYIHILPENLNYKCNIEPEERYRGIYKTVVYKANLIIDGDFKLPNFNKLTISESDIIWDKVQLNLKISDFRSLQTNLDWSYNEEKLEFSPGANTGLVDGVFAIIDWDESQREWQFESELNFNGSAGIFFYPLGKETKVELSSDWKSPSFTGEFLPDERKVDEKGFMAKWKVLLLNRQIGQIQKDVKEISYEGFSFGVDLLIPVDHYTKSERSIKYATLFTALTFITFFAISLKLKVKVHIIHYLLVGFALSLFYSLMLSISEHLGFDLAYWISMIAMLLLLGIYSKAIFNDSRFAAVLSFLIFALYLFIYVILQLEDFALLVGNIGLLIIIAFLMYFSIKLKQLEK